MCRYVIQYSLNLGWFSGKLRRKLPVFQYPCRCWYIISPALALPFLSSFRVSCNCRLFISPNLFNSCLLEGCPYCLNIFPERVGLGFALVLILFMGSCFLDETWISIPWLWLPLVSDEWSSSSGFAFMLFDSRIVLLMYSESGVSTKSLM